MQKRKFIILFIGTHIGFIFLQIHKQSYLVKLSYQKQKKEKLQQDILEKKKQLTQQWHMVQNRSAIKDFAQKQLGMKKVALNQITLLEQ